MGVGKLREDRNGWHRIHIRIEKGRMEVGQERRGYGNMGQRTEQGWE